MRILVIAPEQLPVPPIKGGSVETVIYEIFRRVSRKHSVVLVSRSHPRLPSVSEQNDGRLKIVRVADANHYRYIKKALQNVKGKPFNVIQVENRPIFVPHVRRTFKNTPIMLSLHSLTFMSQLSQKRAQNILKQTNGVTSVSKFLKLEMQRRFRMHADKFRTAKLGVNTDTFRPRSQQFKQQLRKQWGGFRHIQRFVRRANGSRQRAPHVSQSGCPVEKAFPQRSSDRHWLIVAGCKVPESIYEEGSPLVSNVRRSHPVHRLHSPGSGCQVVSFGRCAGLPIHLSRRLCNGQYGSNGIGNSGNCLPPWRHYKNHYTWQEWLFGICIHESESFRQLSHPIKEFPCVGKKCSRRGTPSGRSIVQLVKDRDESS